MAAAWIIAFYADKQRPQNHSSNVSKDFQLGFIQAVKSAFSNYANFEGRALRSQYWYFVLFLLIGDFIFSFLDAAISGMSWARFMDSGRIGVTGTIFSLVTLLPFVSLAARRLHDINRSGWWMLIPLTIIGIIPYLYWVIKEGSPASNDYGAPVQI